MQSPTVEASEIQKSIHRMQVTILEIHINKAQNSCICARSFSSLLISISQIEMAKRREDHNSHIPGTESKSISHRGPKSTIQATSPRSTLPPAPPCPPTPHPNFSRPHHKHLQHNNTHANAHEYKETPPVKRYRSRWASRSRRGLL